MAGNVRIYNLIAFWKCYYKEGPNKMIIFIIIKISIKNSSNSMFLEKTAIF